MPISQKKILTHSYCGDQYIQYNTFIWFNQIGDTKSTPTDKFNEELSAQGFTLGVALSQFEQLKIAILDSIEQNNQDRLGELLSRDFICKKISSSTEKTHNGDAWVESTSEICHVRPALEAYFSENIDDLMEFIAAVVNKNDINLMVKFMIAFDDADFFMKRLGVWDDEIKNNTLKCIENLLQHGNKLINKYDEESVLKGDQIINLVNELNNVVGKRSTAQPIGLKGLFENILFKFRLTKLLHSKDEVLTHHRGYKEEFLNGLSIAFTLTAANVANRVKTGDFFFKAKTKSEDKIEKIERSLYPSRN